MRVSNAEDDNQLEERNRIPKRVSCLVCINTERKAGKSIRMAQDICKLTCSKREAGESDEDEEDDENSVDFEERGTKYQTYYFLDLFSYFYPLKYFQS